MAASNKAWSAAASLNFILLSTITSSSTVAFSVGGLQHYSFFCGDVTRSNSRLFNKVGPSDDGGEAPEFDVETARKQFESQLGSNDDPSSSSASLLSGSTSLSLESLLSSDDITVPAPPPLSTIERDRRMAELHILERLADGDEATADLWQLWYSERGTKAQALLKQADQLMGDPTSWQDCENTLTQLIEDYGFYFVEPVNRLATLYYLQGRFDDAYKLCAVILKIKPWHFGALSGIVQVCISKGDRQGARLWAEKRLPTSVVGTSPPQFAEDEPVNPRRMEWVEQMVATAEEFLQASEKNTRKSFGKPEEYYRGTEENSEIILEDEDGGAWQ